MVHEEGRAAGMMQVARDANPYRRAIVALAMINREPESITYEHASDWESGWQAGHKQAKESSSSGLGDEPMTEETST